MGAGGSGRGFAFFMRAGHDDSQRQDFFKSWLALEPQAAVNALPSSGSEWEKVARSCLTDIARVAPNRVAEIVSRLTKPDDYWDTSVRDAFAIVAETGLDQARRTAEQITGPNRDQALAGVARFWGRSDLNSAIAWAKGLPEGTDRNEIIRAALMGKATVDPAAALEGVGLVPEGGRPGYFACTTGARVLMEAAQTDFDGTVAWLASHPGQIGGREDLYGLVGAVTEKLNADPAGFLSQHATDETLKVMVPAIENALLNGSSGQLGAVWDWLKSQPENDQTGPLKKEVLQCAASSLAFQIIKELPETPEGDQAVKQVAERLLNGGYRLGNIEQMLLEAPNRLHTPIIESAFEFLNARNLYDPQEWAKKLQLLPEADRNSGTEKLAHAWAEQSPDEAIAWAGSLAQGAGQDAAIAAIVSGWAGKDAHGAADWVATMSAGPQRDRSTEALVNAVAEQFPREAWEWATSINNPEERDRAADRVIQVMAQRDPTTARQWIDSGPFTAETKRNLQASLQKPTRSH